MLLLKGWLNVQYGIGLNWNVVKILTLCLQFLGLALIKVHFFFFIVKSCNFVFHFILIYEIRSLISIRN